ncbi:hypothetical protein D1AOALGA4SA_3416 [Olavius algarvensis Delta 1 endosymbiont]|nr:hypothetical protein D1AOALGA4SA_3416 [Olavius algarvensis Delta 1 endosymbiont]
MLPRRGSPPEVVLEKLGILFDKKIMHRLPFLEKRIGR